LKLAVVLLRFIAALTFCAPSTGFEAGLRWGLTLLPGAGRHLVVAGRRESGLTDSRVRDGLSPGNHRMPAREVPKVRTENEPVRLPGANLQNLRVCLSPRTAVQVNGDKRGRGGETAVGERLTLRSVRCSWSHTLREWDDGG